MTWTAFAILAMFIIKHRSFHPKTTFITSFSSGNVLGSVRINTKTAQNLCQRRHLLVKLLWFVKSRKWIYNISPKQKPWLLGVITGLNTSSRHGILLNFRDVSLSNMALNLGLVSWHASRAILRSAVPDLLMLSQPFMCSWPNSEGSCHQKR